MGVQLSYEQLSALRRIDSPTTSFACLHNPAHVERGAAYRFNLNPVICRI